MNLSLRCCEEAQRPPDSSPGEFQLMENKQNVGNFQRLPPAAADLTLYSNLSFNETMTVRQVHNTVLWYE